MSILFPPKECSFRFPCTLRHHRAGVVLSGHLRLVSGYESAMSRQTIYNSPSHFSKHLSCTVYYSVHPNCRSDSAFPPRNRWPRSVTSVKTCLMFLFEYHSHRLCLSSASSCKASSNAISGTLAFVALFVALQIYLFCMSFCS